VNLMKFVNRMLYDRGITDEVSPRDAKRYESLLAKGIQKEVALNKCMIKGKLELSGNEINKLIADSIEWK